MTATSLRMTVPPEDDGKRLDAALAALLPGVGLRGRRRLCQNGLALVDGWSAPPAFRVRAGQELAVVGTAEDPSAQAGQGCAHDDRPAAVIRRSDDLAFLHKPAGMHTAAIEGSPVTSLESLLPVLLPGCPAARLLNRLDAPTSGIVAAALDEEGAAMYRAAQAAGRTEKRYLAVLEGALGEPAAVRRRIVQDGRKRVRVMDEDDADPARRTLIFPLAVFRRGDAAFLFLQDGEAEVFSCLNDPVTLAVCVIFRGARHQIRAHAASLGFPLLGDARYGSLSSPALPGEVAGEHFFLHHARLSLPGVEVTDLPDWLDPLCRAGIVMEKDVLGWLERSGGCGA